jgi:hypothetical protein
MTMERETHNGLEEGGRAVLRHERAGVVERQLVCRDVALAHRVWQLGQCRTHGRHLVLRHV